MPRTYTTPQGVTLTFSHALGAGQFGVASAVRNRKGDVFCLKEVTVRTTDEDAKALALQEVRVMKDAQHPNVVQYFDSWFERHRLCILMEYAPNASLDKVIAQYAEKRKRFSEQKVTHFLQELAGALDMLATCAAEQREVTMASWTCPSRRLPVDFTRLAELALIASVLVRFVPA